MKKFLLFGLAAMMSTTMFAQSLEPDLIEVMAIETAEGPDIAAVEGMEAQTRSVANGVYYAKPYGMMYRRYYSATNGTYYNSQYYYPAFQAPKFINMSTDKSSTQWNYKTSAGSTGTNYDADSDGNFTYGTVNPTASGYCSYYIPYIYGPDDHYCMAYYDNDGGKADSYMHQIYASGHIETGVTEGYPGYDPDGYYMMGWVDNKTNSISSTSYDTKYVYGSGFRASSTSMKVINNETGVESTVDGYALGFPRDGVYFHYPAPAGPLYVKSIILIGMTAQNLSENTSADTTYDPIQNGAVLTINISDADTEEVIASLTATTGDWTYLSTSTSTTFPKGFYLNGYVTFTQKDENGDVVPFVITGKTRVDIVGFGDYENIDLGLKNTPIQDCDTDDGYDVAYNTFIDPSGVYTVEYHSYFSGKTVNMSFEAVMDAVNVADALTTGSVTYDGYRNVTITADGTENYSTDQEKGSTYDFGGLYIRTAMPWDTADGGSNYSLADAPEWITGITGVAYGSSANVYRVTLQAEENLYEARQAVVHIQCHGFVDSADITVTQEAGAYTGITEVEANEAPAKTGAIYNLAGQKVNESAKGVVIVDGKKVIK